VRNQVTLRPHPDYTAYKTASSALLDKLNLLTTHVLQQFHEQSPDKHTVSLGFSFVTVLEDPLQE